MSTTSSAKSGEEGAGGEWNHRLASLKAQPGSHHHFSNAETYQLATFINARFAEEPLLSTLVPVDGTNPDEFFNAWGDGRLLICLVDAACEGVVDLNFLRRRAAKPLGVSVRHMTIQHFAVLNDALEGCKSISGLRLGFVGAEDFAQGNRPVILGVGWQLVRLAILQKANIVDRPELAELFTPEEAAKQLGNPGQEELVLARWFNQYLDAVGSDRQVWSFGAELADGVAWCTLFNAIDPAACPPADERDPEENAINAIMAVHKMGVKGVFLTKESLMLSDKKQNMMLAAQVMDVYPTVPSHLRAPKPPKNRKGSFSSYSSYYSRDDASTAAASSLFTSSSPGGERVVGSSSAPPPVPSPPKSRWGFGFNNTPRDVGSSGAPREIPMKEAGERSVYYDSDGEVESTPGCGLGFGLFACISRM